MKIDTYQIDRAQGLLIWWRWMAASDKMAIVYQCSECQTIKLDNGKMHRNAGLAVTAQAVAAQGRRDCMSHHMLPGLAPRHNIHNVYK